MELMNGKTYHKKSVRNVSFNFFGKTAVKKLCKKASHCYLKTGRK